MLFFFFFQAEDGIRDRTVTGVQTCALPISGKHLGLTLVGAVVDEDAGGPLGLSRPEIAFPSSHADEAQTVEIDIAVMAMPDVPEQHRLAETVVRGLGEGAGARDGATAIVEPVSRDVPAGNLSHADLHSP